MINNTLYSISLLGYKKNDKIADFFFSKKINFSAIVKTGVSGRFSC